MPQLEQARVHLQAALGLLKAGDSPFAHQQTLYQLLQAYDLLRPFTLRDDTLSPFGPIKAHAPVFTRFQNHAQQAKQGVENALDELEVLQTRFSTPQANTVADLVIQAIELL